jgi:hypothetical protein
MSEPDHPSVAQLTAFDAGQLPPDERETVEMHVGGCRVCCRLLDSLPENPLAALVRAAGTAAPDLPPALVGHPRYRLLELLGAGGMGVVYKAVHRHMDRLVALKIIDRRLSGRPDFIERFRREVKAAARLSHPNIVSALDAEQADDLHFLVMEYVPGISLDKELQRRGAFPVALACDLVRQAALGLEHAHQQGMVHRDIKPANLLLTPTHQIKILDFGLALTRMEGDEPMPPGSAPSAILLGTPDYLAPEQAQDPEHVDPRADIYSLGCTLHHLLTGQPPYPGASPLQKLLGHQQRQPPSLAELRPDVPEPLAAIVTRMLAKDPSQRYPTAVAVADDLAIFAAGGLPRVAARTTSPQRWFWAAALVLVAAALLIVPVSIGAILVWQQLPRDDSPSGSAQGSPRDAAKGPAEHPPLAGPPAEVATLEPGPLSAPQMRDQVVTWVRLNNRFGPGHRLVSDIAGNLDANSERFENFQLSLGAGLVKSQKYTVLAAHQAGLFMVEIPESLDPELKRDAVKRTFEWYAPSRALRRVPGTAELSALSIKNSRSLSAADPVTGQLTYRILSKPTAKLALRLTYYFDRTRRIMLIYPKELGESPQGVLDFTMAPLATADLHPRGPLLLFVELSTQGGVQEFIESNAVAALVNVKEGNDP